MNKKVDKTDTEIMNEVLAELEYEPRVKATDIGVLVKDGIVTLNGYARTLGEKWDAVRAAKRIAGVKAIADDIEVKMLDSHRHTDGDIAAAVVNQIQWSTTIPAETLIITVHEGLITLEGEVEWWYQKNAAEKVVLYLAGVKGVSNRISIKPEQASTESETAIKSALKRNALFLDADSIDVKVSGGNVTLSGKVRNYAERDAAELVAWDAQGVVSVDNKLTVKWSLRGNA